MHLSGEYKKNLTKGAPAQAFSDARDLFGPSLCLPWRYTALAVDDVISVRHQGRTVHRQFLTAAELAPQNVIIELEYATCIRIRVEKCERRSAFA